MHSYLSLPSSTNAKKQNKEAMGAAQVLVAITTKTKEEVKGSIPSIQKAFTNQ